MIFQRHPLEKVWIKLEKYEQALGSISSIKPRLAKRITGALKNSLKGELVKRRSRGTCSAYGLIDVIYSCNVAVSDIQFLVENPGLYTYQQLRACQKAVFAAGDLTQAFQQLYHALVQGRVKVSDPRDKGLLPRVRPLDIPYLLVTLDRRYQLARLSGPGVTDAAMDRWWQQVAALIDELLFFGQDMVAIPRRQPKRNRGQVLESGDHQRLLVSCLASGSASQKAHRIGVSRRAVYTCLRKIIYTPNPDKLLEY